MFKEHYLQIPFLREFTVEALGRLLDYSTEMAYQADEIIFKQGDLGRELYVVASGKVRFEFENPEGEKKVLSWATYGSLFGEIAFLQPQPRTATAIAEEPSELLVFQKADVQKLIDLYPSLAATFYHSIALELAVRLRNTNPRIS